MTNSTWTGLSGTGDYNTAGNWSLGIPGSIDTAFFGTSTVTDISMSTSNAEVGAWVFNPWARQYSFSLSHSNLTFTGAGIIINCPPASTPSIEIGIHSEIDFYDNSTAGGASITVDGNATRLQFHDGSTAGVALIYNSIETFFSDNSSADHATIENHGDLEFMKYSDAGAATIHTWANSFTEFFGSSTGASAELNTELGGTVDFSQSAGPNGDRKLTIGSIAGAGAYHLGADQLTVLSGDVSGLIDGLGGSLVKLGPGTLKLSGANNTYSGGTTIDQGTLDLAALGAAGTDDIAFGGKLHATLTIENAALFGHHFTNNIDFFGKHDVLDLSGLKFHKGATAKYHPATDILDVHSGHVTDVFTLLSPHGTHFAVTNDGHGSTTVTLDPPHHTAVVASLSTNDVAEQHWATDIAGSAGHLSDFLFTA